MIADSVVAIAMQIEANPAALHDRMILPTRPPSAAVPQSRGGQDVDAVGEMQGVVHSLLCARYGDDPNVLWTPPSKTEDGLFYVTTEGAGGPVEGMVSFPALTVDSEDAELKKALLDVLSDVANVTRPFALV
tara:strand:+ start:313 stop:708 length:396 start_codon:yes stop_codon:yes gene_type:complete